MSDIQTESHTFGSFQVNFKEWEENIDEYVSTHYSEDVVDLKLEYQKSLWDSFDNKDGQCISDHVTSENDVSDIQTESHTFGSFQVNFKEWEENIDEYVSTHYSEDVVDLRLVDQEWEENIDEYVSTHYSEDVVDLKLEYQKSLWDSFGNEDGQCSSDHVASEDHMPDVQTGSHIFEVNLKEWEENIDEYVSTHYSEDVVDLKLEYQKSQWDSFDNEDSQCSSSHVAREDVMSDVQTDSHVFGGLEFNLKEWEENIDEYVSTNYSEDVVDLRLVDQEGENSFEVQQQKVQDLNTEDVKNNVSIPNIQSGRQLLEDTKKSFKWKVFFSPRRKAIFRSRFKHHQTVGDISEEDIENISEEKNDGQEEKEKKSKNAGRKNIMQRLRSLCFCMRRKE
ncbi:uncharacterized protein LOC125660088 [Ostrea edulis]|uniref:uncharacterized protein LOC125660088 n=1 Tax=Ostrea edulis TaxID=37623 RepID=UPI0024AF7F7D|nr:uncharacterized protein LOC125660088 [Ostrea edulis]